MIGNGENYYWFVKVGRDGEVLADTKYSFSTGSTNGRYSYADGFKPMLLSATYDGYVTFGNHPSYEENINSLYWILTLDSTGHFKSKQQIVFDQEVNSVFDPVGTDFVVATDNDYDGLHFFRIGGNGKIIWDTTISNIDIYDIKQVIVTKDNGYLVAGTASNPDQYALSNVVLLKFAPDDPSLPKGSNYLGVGDSATSNFLIARVIIIVIIVVTVLATGIVIFYRIKITKPSENKEQTLN
jgi:hypothetical protein